MLFPPRRPSPAFLLSVKLVRQTQGSARKSGASAPRPAIRDDWALAPAGNPNAMAASDRFPLNWRASALGREAIDTNSAANSPSCSRLSHSKSQSRSAGQRSRRRKAILESPCSADKTRKPPPRSPRWFSPRLEQRACPYDPQDSKTTDVRIRDRGAISLRRGQPAPAHRSPHCAAASRRRPVSCARRRTQPAPCALSR